VLFEAIEFFFLNYDIVIFLKLLFYNVLILLIVSLGVVTQARIGINEWLVPQISEHCPENSPRRLENKKIWLRRPGRASTFTPIEGIVHE